MAQRAGAVVLRCDRCRLDKKACYPRFRSWPERRCDRCIHFNYGCGPNVPPPRSSATVASTDGSRQALLALATLVQVDWEGAGTYECKSLKGEQSNLVGLLAIVSAYMKSEYTASNMILYRLWERIGYISCRERWDEIYQALLPRANPRSRYKEARLEAAKLYIKECQDKQIEGRIRPFSTDVLENAVYSILIRGQLWRELLDEIKSCEILLLDQSVPFTSNLNIGEVIYSGNREAFTSLKHYLKDPENGVERDCQLLRGASDMVIALAESPEDSDLRKYLTKEVQRRIEHAFGAPPELPRLDRHIKSSLPRPYSDAAITDLLGFHIDMPLASEEYPKLVAAGETSPDTLRALRDIWQLRDEDIESTHLRDEGIESMHPWTYSTSDTFFGLSNQYDNTSDTFFGLFDQYVRRKHGV